MASNRIKGFDGLRGAASFAVVLHHTMISGTHLGEVAVNSFFALSGFLILGILGNGRTSIDLGRSTFRSELSTFWQHRALRILPVYYVMLGFLVLLSVTIGGFADVRQEFLWYLLYAQNFLIAFVTLKWGSFSQTWSLAVEQQFYVVFGFIFLLVPRRWTGIALLLLSLICLSAQMMLVLGQFPEKMQAVLPFQGFLFIIAGGTIVLHRPKLPQSYRPSTGVGDALIWAVVVLLGAITLLPNSGGNSAFWSDYLPVTNGLVALVVLALVAALLWLLTEYPESSIVRLLEMPVFVFLGSISYALYVIHYPLLGALHGGLLKLHCTWNLTFTTAAVGIPACIFLCYLSRQFLERPILKLKRRRSSRPQDLAPTAITQ